MSESEEPSLESEARLNKDAIKAPEISVPEGIFLPIAVFDLGQWIYGASDLDSRQLSKCKEIISTWILSDTVKCFMIEDLSHKEELAPKRFFRLPSIDHVFDEGVVEKESAPGQVSIGRYIKCWVYLDKRDFERNQKKMTPENIDSIKTGDPGRPGKLRDIYMSEFVRRKDAGILEKSCTAEAQKLREFLIGKYGRTADIPSAKTIENRIRSEFRGYIDSINKFPQN